MDKEVGRMVIVGRRRGSGVVIMWGTEQCERETGDTSERSEWC